MRRTLFYLSVALLAFGIGSFVVFKSYWKVDENPVAVQPIEETKVDKIELTPNLVRQDTDFFKPKESFKCENKFLLAVWNDLRKDEDLKEVFDRGIQNNELADCSEVIGIDKLIDLNGDGRGEAFINGKGWLNGLDERRIWIVGKIGENYKVILDSLNVSFATLEHKTNGYVDLIETEKISIPEYEKTLYQFSGNTYKANKCWTEIIAARDKREMIYELKKPRKSFHKCF